MQSVSEKFVLKLLMMKQKQLCLEGHVGHADCVKSDTDFLNIMITGDEL